MLSQSIGKLVCPSATNKMKSKLAMCICRPIDSLDLYQTKNHLQDLCGNCKALQMEGDMFQW